VLGDQFGDDFRLDDHDYIDGDSLAYKMKILADSSDNVLMCYDGLQKALGLPKWRLARHEKFLRGK
jgi:hypothetical protein